MQLLLLGLHGEQLRARSAVPGVVAGQHGDIGARLGHADLITGALHGAEVTHHDDLLPLLVNAAEGDHALLAVVAGDPLEALPVGVVAPQGGVVQVVVVQIPHIRPELLVLFEVQQEPVQLLLLVPLDKLAELAAHEQELLARVGHHVPVKRPQAMELVGVVPRHLVDEGALPMHHLVVGQGQDKVLRESVGQGEGDIVMLALPEQGIGGHIVHHIVHPAHVPLEVEAQAVEVLLGLGDVGVGGGLLRHHDHVGIEGEGGGVHVLEEGHRVQVDIAAVLVGSPLAAPASVIQVEHGGHRVHPDAVHVELFQPVDHVGDQEGAHLIPAVIKDPGAPVRMLPAEGIGGLVAVPAVKLKQAALVPGEVRTHPVDDNADAPLVAQIHELHEVVGGAVPGGGGVVARNLIAPGGVIGELADGEQLHVGVAHLL